MLVSGSSQVFGRVVTCLIYGHMKEEIVKVRHVLQQKENVVQPRGGGGHLSKEGDLDVTYKVRCVNQGFCSQHTGDSPHSLTFMAPFFHPELFQFFFGGGGGSVSHLECV